MVRDRRKISKWQNNTASGLIIVLRIINVHRVTIAYNLDVIWGYLLAAGFSAVPAVFLVLNYHAIDVRFQL